MHGLLHIAELGRVNISPRRRRPVLQIAGERDRRRCGAWRNSRWEAIKRSPGILPYQEAAPPALNMRAWRCERRVRLPDDERPELQGCALPRLSRSSTGDAGCAAEAT